MKASTSGWAHCAAFGTDAEKEAATSHRRKMEEECMTTLLADITPLLKDGFNAKSYRYLSGHRIAITLDGLERADVEMTWRYDDGGYRKGSCKGISMKGDGVWQAIPGLGRAYGFDFDTLRMKPATLKKAVGAAMNHLQRQLDLKEHKAKRKSGSQRHAERMADMLREEGFTVDIGEWDNDAQMTIKDVAVLKVSSTGLVFSHGRNESVPIRAKRENIIAVAKAIRDLRVIIAGECHAHG